MQSGLPTVQLQLLAEAQMILGLDKLRPRMKRTNPRKSLMRQARNSPTQAHLSRFIRKCSKTYYGDQYKDAFKAANLIMQMPDSAKGKHATGVRSVLDRKQQHVIVAEQQKAERQYSASRCSVGGIQCVSA